jgi:hypothetical protein
MPQWITTDGKIDTTTPVLKTAELQLKQLQQFVGGYIELVYMNDGSVFVINEEGMLMGLPANREATRLLRLTGTNVLMANGYLQGPALYLTEAEYLEYMEPTDDVEHSAYFDNEDDDDEDDWDTDEDDDWNDDPPDDDQIPDSDDPPDFDKYEPR